MDYVPSNDAEFDIWQDRILAYVIANAIRFNILDTIIDPILVLQTAWDTAWANAKNKNTRSIADVQNKDEKRAAYEKALRKLVQDDLQGNASVTAQDCLKMRITLRKTTRSAVPKPSLKVIVNVVPGINATVKISIAYQLPDSATAKRGKPKGSKLVEFVYGEGDNLDVKQCTNTLIITKTSLEIDLDKAWIGNTVTCYARFLTASALAGDWNSATYFMVYK